MESIITIITLNDGLTYFVQIVETGDFIQVHTIDLCKNFQKKNCYSLISWVDKLKMISIFGVENNLGNEYISINIGFDLHIDVLNYDTFIVFFEMLQYNLQIIAVNYLVKIILISMIVGIWEMMVVYIKSIMATIFQLIDKKSIKIGDRYILNLSKFGELGLFKKLDKKLLLYYSSRGETLIIENNKAEIDFDKNDCMKISVNIIIVSNKTDHNKFNKQFPIILTIFQNELNDIDCLSIKKK